MSVASPPERALELVTSKWVTSPRRALLGLALCALAACGAPAGSERAGVSADVRRPGAPSLAPPDTPREVSAEPPEAAPPDGVAAPVDAPGRVLDRERQILYEAGAAGLTVRHLAGGTAEHLTHAPTRDGCARRDVPTALSPSGHRLLFTRLGPCGPEGLEIARDHALARDGERSPWREVALRSVAALVSAGGTVWLGEGGRCDLPGPIDSDPEGALWRSDDGGRAWSRVPWPDAEAPWPAVAELLALPSPSPDEPSALILLSARCRVGAREGGGALLVSQDGGRTWARRTPPGPGYPVHVESVAPREGPGAHEPTRLIAWLSDGARVTSLDLGQTWTALNPTPAPPRRRPAPLAVGSARLAVDDEGLLRLGSSPSEPAERVWPPESVTP